MNENDVVELQGFVRGLRVGGAARQAVEYWESQLRLLVARLAKGSPRP